MKQNIVEFVLRCLIYQQVKIVHQWSDEKKQLLDIP